MDFFKKLYNDFTGFLFPETCFQCGNKLIDRHYFCDDCYSSLKYISLEDQETLHLQKFRDTFIDGIITLFYFHEGAISQRIIHLIKYEKYRKLGIGMGKDLGSKITSNHSEKAILIPVPIHKTRKRERGFNQAEIIGQGIMEISLLKMDKDIIFRKKYTESQTKLGKEERLENVSDAFSFNSKKKYLVEGSTIFLLDDVITTGSTMNACAKVLKENGAGNVIAVSLGFAC